MFTEVFWEKVQVVAQVLEELLLLRWLLDLEERVEIDLMVVQGLVSCITV